MPRSALVVVAAVIPVFNLPEAGVLLIMGIDHFLDMGRTATNVPGERASPPSVVAKWENALGTEIEEEEEAAFPAPSLSQSRPSKQLSEVLLQVFDLCNG